MTQRQSVLLLTAAINTSPRMQNNQRSASDVRRADYRHALEFYIEALPVEVRHIVFCENTGADLSDFETLKLAGLQAGRELHFVSFVGVTSPELGKGVCEFEILDRAYHWIGAQLPDDTIVWKVTGRLVVKNIARLIRSCPPDAEVYADMRSVPFIGESLGGNDWVDMRLMAYSLRAYSRLMLDRGQSFGYVSEKGLFRALLSAHESGAQIAPRFRSQPRFRGICGGSNKDYESVQYRVKDTIRILSRTFTPGLWL